jgi:hypothetical protein
MYYFMVYYFTGIPICHSMIVYFAIVSFNKNKIPLIKWISGMIGVRTPALCIYNVIFLPIELSSRDNYFHFFFTPTVFICYLFFIWYLYLYVGYYFRCDFRSNFITTSRLILNKMGFPLVLDRSYIWVHFRLRKCPFLCLNEKQPNTFIYISFRPHIKIHVMPWFAF